MSEEQHKDNLCQKGYYIVSYGFMYQVMRIRRTVNGLIKHNYGWEKQEDWLDRNPVKIEKPTIWDRITNII